MSKHPSILRLGLRNVGASLFHFTAAGIGKQSKFGLLYLPAVTGVTILGVQADPNLEPYLRHLLNAVCNSTSFSECERIFDTSGGTARVYRETRPNFVINVSEQFK
jgi:hypothetical protein